MPADRSVPTVTVRTSDQITQMQRSLVHAAKHLQSAGQGGHADGLSEGGLQEGYSVFKEPVYRSLLTSLAPTLAAPGRSLR
jgi:hypothetical protein